MKIRALQILASLAIACGLIDAEQTRAAAGPAKSAFVFDGIGYLHRWSMNHQHEFTPKGQEDLEKWSDMITINVYPNAHDGEALAVNANAVLENYKGHKGMVLKTDSVPRTPDRPAEHFIAVVFGRPNFIEVAFARFKLVDGLGCSIVYSHRIYGEKIGGQMSAWLKNNGAKMEKALIEWTDIPSPASLNRELDRNASLPSDTKASPSSVSPTQQLMDSRSLPSRARRIAILSTEELSEASPRNEGPDSRLSHQTFAAYVVPLCFHAIGK